ncbi:hypothetical protein QL285_084459 [Trifolium repens]|nr:hypothetical protein QL285_084459 [Trifolium repens]
MGKKNRHARKRKREKPSFTEKEKVFRRLTVAREREPRENESGGWTRGDSIPARDGSYDGGSWPVMVATDQTLRSNMELKDVEGLIVTIELKDFTTTDKSIFESKL